MRIRSVLSLLLLSAVVGGLTAGTASWFDASAHGGAKGVVKDRMETMEDIEEMIERLYAIYRGDLPYSEKAVRKAAGEIRKRSGKSLTALFPKGSDGEPSEARPEVWTKAAEFERLAGRLEMIAAALEKRADPRPSNASVLPKKWENAVPRGMMGGGMMGGSGSSGGGSGGMMGGGMMGGTGGGPPPEMLARMPAEMLVLHMSHVCNVCHTQFRKEDE